MDRLLVTSMLDADRFEISTANDGVEGLAACADLTPDLMITDVVMPNMSGLELLVEVQNHHPKVPVVVMTATGSEEIAVEALQKGAASYVAKPVVTEKMVETVDQIIEMARTDRDYSRLLQHMDESRYRYNLGSDFALILPMVEFIQGLAFGLQICDGRERRQIGIAVEEALINAIFHGNLELPADMREEIRSAVHFGTPIEIANERLQDPEFLKRNVAVDMMATPEVIQIIIEDDGQGFDHASFRENRSENQQAEGKRGILLIESFMDAVTFNESGNRVKLIKARP